MLNLLKKLWNKFKKKLIYVVDIICAPIEEVLVFIHTHIVYIIVIIILSTVTIVALEYYEILETNLHIYVAYFLILGIIYRIFIKPFKKQIKDFIDEYFFNKKKK